MAVPPCIRKCPLEYRRIRVLCRLPGQRLSRTPPRGAGRSPGAQRRGVGSSGGMGRARGRSPRRPQAAAPMRRLPSAGALTGLGHIEPLRGHPKGRDGRSRRRILLTISHRKSPSGKSNHHESRLTGRFPVGCIRWFGGLSFCEACRGFQSGSRRWRNDFEGCPRQDLNILERSPVHRVTVTQRPANADVLLCKTSPALCVFQDPG